jgi:hypothetical protein
LAAASDLNVPRFFLFPDLSFFFEYNRYSPEESFLIISRSEKVQIDVTQSSLRCAAASFLLSVFIRDKLVPPSYDLRLPLELDLDCGVHDRFFAESFEGCAEVVGGWGEVFDLG